MLDYRVCFQILGNKKWFDISHKANLTAAKQLAQAKKSEVANSFKVPKEIVRMVVKQNDKIIMEV